MDVEALGDYIATMLHGLSVQARNGVPKSGCSRPSRTRLRLDAVNRLIRVKLDLRSSEECHVEKLVALQLQRPWAFSRYSRSEHFTMRLKASLNALSES